MIRSILLVLFSLLGLTSIAQTAQNLFEWGTNSSIIVNQKFIPREIIKFNHSSVPSNIAVYSHGEYNLTNQLGQKYTLKLHRLYNPKPNTGNSYDGFSILHQGKNILSYYPGYEGSPLYNSEFLTLGKDKSPYLQIPLDNKSFALCFGGWYYDQNEAPELVIVVISNDKAKVVFDNYAFAYKYTPAPNFAIEFVDDWSGIDHYKSPSLSSLGNRTKHKIWREGNLLKYKSWK